jgi:hypothetical protein
MYKIAELTFLFFKQNAGYNKYYIGYRFLHSKCDYLLYLIIT